MSGFYKNENGVLLHGPNFVLNAEYELRAETQDEHEYPVDGWYWFDTEDEAYLFFGIEKPAEPDLPIRPPFNAIIDTDGN